ncbi:MAG: dirigent protein [Solirubrobacteraceae bacterium]
MRTQSHGPRKARRRAPALLAGAVITTAGLLAATGGTAVGQTRHGSTVHVIEHAVTDTVVPSGGGADVTGNTLTFHNKVYNRLDKKQVGHDQGFCVRISPAEGTYECMWTTFLAHGQITVEGPFYDKKNSVLAITGGTGAYRSARGEMNLNSRHGGAEYDFIFHIA